MALAPWNVLASGKFRTDEEEQNRRETGEKGREMLTGGWERNENEKKVSHALEKVAKEVGASHITAGKFHYIDLKNTLMITGNAVAIAYLMQKTPYVFPLVGGRKVEQLYGNLEALDISLSPEQIKYLESIIPFDPGFPTSMIARGASLSRLYQADASSRRAMGHLLLCCSSIPLISRRFRASNQLCHRIIKNYQQFSCP